MWRPSGGRLGSGDPGVDASAPFDRGGTAGSHRGGRCSQSNLLDYTASAFRAVFSYSITIRARSSK
jgi:hypothetical protein